METTPQDITIAGIEFEKYIPYPQILAAVQNLAEEINRDYEGREIKFVSVLNGSFMFTADLLKYIKVPCTVSFIRAKSYHGMNTTGKVTLSTDLAEPLKDLHVIVLEDIVDTGLTINMLSERIEKEQPASYKICSLLLKPEIYKGERKIDYTGIHIPNDFIVGYGLDFNEHGRNLADIYKVK
jgi:hypoxanthine phosphoribosyltransferase